MSFVQLDECSKPTVCGCKIRNLYCAVHVIAVTEKRAEKIAQDFFEVHYRGLKEYVYAERV